MNKRCEECRYGLRAEAFCAQMKRRHDLSALVWVALIVAALLFFAGGTLFGWSLAVYGVERVVGGKYAQ